MRVEEAVTTTYTVIGGVIVHEVRGGVQRNYRPDTLGSTIALTDATSATDTWEYWPYGEVRSHSGSNVTPFTFVGTLGYCKSASISAMTYVRARMYMPSRGRWATVDPTWPQEPEYQYCWNSVSSLVDPDGSHPQQIPKRKKWVVKIILPPPIIGVPPITLDLHLGYGNWCGSDRNPRPECKKLGIPAPKPWDNVDACCIDHDDKYNRFSCDAFKNVSTDCRKADEKLCECLNKQKCNHINPKDQADCNGFRNDAINWFCNIKPKL